MVANRLELATPNDRFAIAGIPVRANTAPVAGAAADLRRESVVQRRFFRIHDSNHHMSLTWINRSPSRSQIISNVSPCATVRIEFRVVEVPAAASTTDTPRIYGMETKHEHQ